MKSNLLYYMFPTWDLRARKSQFPEGNYLIIITENNVLTISSYLGYTKPLTRLKDQTWNFVLHILAC